MLTLSDSIAVLTDSEKSIWINFFCWNVLVYLYICVFEYLYICVFAYLYVYLSDSNAVVTDSEKSIWIAGLPFSQKTI